MINLLSTAASAALGFVGKAKVYLIAGTVAVATCFGCFEAGVMKGHEQAAETAAKSAASNTQVEVAAATNAGNQKVGAVVAQNVKDQDEDVARNLRDAKAVDHLADVTSGIVDTELKLNQANDHETDYPSSCNLRVGDVGLLDFAATGGLGSANGSGGAQAVSDPAGVLAPQSQATSDLGERAFVGDEIAVRSQYRELAADHDALIDWVQRELIQPMVAQSKADQPAPTTAATHK